MKLSVIIPVYNAEAFIKDTVENILSQEFKDFELILVNDGCNDQSSRLCDDFSCKDERIKKKKKKNAGVSPARNAGLNLAQGDYVGFVDNDDFIHPQMYDILLSVAAKTDADCVMSFEKKMFDIADIEKETKKYDISKIEYSYLEKSEFYNNLFSNSSTDGPYMAIWNKVYRRDCIKKVQVKTNAAEDLLFNCLAANSSERFVVLNQNINLYYWVQRCQSQSNNFLSGYRAYLLGTYFQLSYEMSRVQPKYAHFALEKTFSKVLSVRYNYKNSVFEAYVSKLIKDRFPLFVKDFNKNKNICLLHKAAYITMYYFPFVYSFIRRRKEGDPSGNNT